MSKTKPFTNSRRRLQKGAALIESLVGMLILSIAVLGSLLALAQSMRLQHVNGVRAQVIDQLRGQLMSKGAGLCATSFPLQVSSHEVQVVVECEPYANVQVSIPGAQVVPVSLAANESQIITARATSVVLGDTLTVTSSR